MRIINTTLIAVLMILLGVQYSFSQIIAPTGISTRSSSQLIYYYDQADNDTIIQIVNTHPTVGTWIHVQIFRSFNITPDPLVNQICDERDFVDFLTPTDTHVYDLGTVNFAKNDGESTSIDVTGTKGFVVITPIVSETDLSAKSFQFLTGTSREVDNIGFLMNAMGRDAVNFTTGEIEAPGVVLDGTTNGYINLQPEELLFKFATEGDEVDIVGVAFTDNYDEPGLLGYSVTPANASWTTFLFDFKEDPTSCGNRPVNCFTTAGLNDTVEQNNQELSPNTEDLLCQGTETPEYPGDIDLNYSLFGWARIFTSGLEDNENMIGFFVQDDDVEGADFMHVRGERTEIEPPPMEEDCAVEGDEDEDGFADCLDTDCATAAECETGAEECADGMDNDEDSQTDCADLGCDGFAGCEFGEEMSCDDGIDNDADGLVDSDDDDCVEETTGGDGGDGGGCVVASTVSTSTPVANFLILMLLPLAVAYRYRKLRRRN